MALIRFQKPALYRKDMDAVLQTMVDEKIGPGERKREFLKLFSAFVSQKDGIALRSYLDVIMASLVALDIAEGDSVIISVLSPRIYLEAMRRLGIKPVIVDTDEYGLLDPETVSESLKDGVKAILYFEPVCQIPASFTAIENMKAVGLPIIEDITESIGSETESDSGSSDEESAEARYVKAGMLGDIVIAALEEDGIISSGGGAVAVSSSQDCIERLKKYADLGSPYVDLPDMNAALGIVQLSKIDTLLERRRNIFQMYLQAQRKSDTRLFGSASPLFSSNGYGFSVIVKARPDDSIAFANKYSVSCKRTFSGSVGQRYQDKYDRFPNAIAFITRAISFPLYPFLSKNDLETIQRVISHIS